NPSTASTDASVASRSPQTVEIPRIASSSASATVVTLTWTKKLQIPMTAATMNAAAAIRARVGRLGVLARHFGCEPRHIDDGAFMRAFADLFLLVRGLDAKRHPAFVHGQHLRAERHAHPHRRRGQMLYVHLGANRV